ncbi:LuxR family transcriptional regulator [Mahella australiensis]|uniref:Transcriptional regulator, LuxR family n=1 Tax=Mahella australiensis (strain DSM 15567 / CIP 107919 / 50-1 BON) TaxID=697281 RepID=F3ZX56_MAHA5|nr:LuxR family transcriptional regulator [Mahella australiensis]AEE95505.1 transcriptional regulator, LuxR family [Mahella australiensis 50-1 BON]
MAEEGHKGILRISADDRLLSVIVFSLFFSWLLAFPFEGQILYVLADSFHMDPHDMVFGAIAVHFAGLFSAGIFVRKMQFAKRMMLFSIVFCMSATAVFFFPPSILWYIALISASFVAGICVASWGYFLKSGTPKNQRIKTTADGLIYSNILMILMNMAAVYSSPYAGLGLSLLVLAMAFLFALRLPEGEQQASPVSPGKIGTSISVVKPLAFLCLFIVIITINSGLMYQVLNPAFAHLEWLTSWYWAIPYIVALYIMRNLPRKTNRTYILYVGIAMIGFSFIAFGLLDRSATSYLVVDTLMLGACGVYDLFWWSILGEMLDFDENPAKVLGIGLSANVFGVLLGGVIGNGIASADSQGISSTLLALAVVCVTLAVLPPLHKRLSSLLSDHAYLTAISETSQKEMDTVMRKFIELGQLTKRESEIVALLLEGKTYRMIAGELHLSENTVKTHIKNVYAKYKIQSRAELINIMLEQQSSLH